MVIESILPSTFKIAEKRGAWSMDDVKGFGGDGGLFGGGSGSIFTILIILFLVMFLFGGKGKFRLFGEEE
jgi:uncharacterized membrane protein